MNTIALHQTSVHSQRTSAAKTYAPLSRGSFFSWLSVLSAGSIGSVLSFASLGSVTSIGSVFSIGSAGSLLSIGSVGSVLSIGSSGRFGSIGDTPVIEPLLRALGLVA